MKKIIFIVSCLILISNCSKNKMDLTKTQKEHLESHFNYGSGYIRQSNKERTFIDVDFSYSRISLDSLGIYRGGTYKCDDGYIFINDYSSCLIHKISLNDIGDHSILGKGIGKGPGQFLNLTGMTFNEKYIFLADGRKRTIEIFNKKNGNFIKSIKTKNANPFRIFMYNDNILIYNIIDRIYPFYLYNTDGNFIKKFGGPLVNKNLLSIHYHESNILKNSEDSFYHISRILGLIGKYENEKLVQVSETIDGVQDPDIIKHGRPRLFTAAHVGLTKDHIICQVKNYEKNTGNTGNTVVDMFFDVYDRQTLNYIHSFKLNADVIEFILYDNLLIGVDKNYDMHLFKFKVL